MPPGERTAFKKLKGYLLRKLFFIGKFLEVSQSHSLLLFNCRTLATELSTLERPTFIENFSAPSVFVVNKEF